ncbi:SH3 domain-containing protein [Streptomyces sp. NPDC054884]|uniref:SH3 domain-containing protein n=1 Tax=Streptomyces sp. ME08-AFT2 TaxID=3028683 RepID=UPI0029A135E0|nr:SH3 domain-containing protein [Streptomyces sp. ME08-AFT2]MDX3311932.1 SH3 domain-containing protein [Streptomyces sp. ME08-AFT2]
MSVDRVEEAGNSDAAEAVATTAAAALTYYPVAPGVRLNVRSGPGTGYSVVRVLAEGARVPVYCQSPGTWVSGPYGTTNIWDNIADGQYVSDAYVHTGSDGYIAPRCS